MHGTADLANLSQGAWQIPIETAGRCAGNDRGRYRAGPGLRGHCGGAGALCRPQGVDGTGVAVGALPAAAGVSHLPRSRRRRAEQAGADRPAGRLRQSGAARPSRADRHRAGAGADRGARPRRPCAARRRRRAVRGCAHPVPVRGAADQRRAQQHARRRDLHPDPPDLRQPRRHAAQPLHDDPELRLDPRRHDDPDRLQHQPARLRHADRSRPARVRLLRLHDTGSGGGAARPGLRTAGRPPPVAGSQHRRGNGHRRRPAVPCPDRCGPGPAPGRTQTRRRLFPEPHRCHGPRHPARCGEPAAALRGGRGAPARRHPDRERDAGGG